ncbi:MAG: hypothetical protein Tsb0020_34700 [Haliangiales bacterium]
MNHRAPTPAAPQAAPAAPAATPALTCRGLVIGHAGRALLPPIDLTLARGQVTLVAGRNGAGKSTWLKTLLGLLPPIAGTVEVSPAAARMSYVPQAAELDRLAPVRAARVVSWGRLRGWQFLSPLASRRDRAAIHAALAEVDASELAQRPFQDLSGGQKQRVLFARLLASDADIALLDEPTAAMDVPAQAAAYRRIADLAAQRHMAVVVVTHNLAAAIPHADAVLLLDRRDPVADGLVLRVAPEDAIAHPDFVRTIGRVTPLVPSGGPTSPASDAPSGALETPVPARDHRDSPAEARS